MPTFKSLAVLAAASVLAACGGGSGDVVSAGTGNTPGGNGDTAAAISVNTFYPMNFYLQGTEYTDKDAYVGTIFAPYTRAYLISPVNATTLKPASSPKLSDYLLTINGQPLDNQEIAPIMQKVLNLPIQLNTALIIDTSASSQPVNKANFIAKVKNYLNAVANSNNPIIKNQRFTLLLAGSQVVAPDLSSTTLAAALDGINWQAQGAQSNLNEAIVKAVGAYKGSNSAEGTELDFSADGIADLLDGYSYSASANSLAGLHLSSVVLFASGDNTMQNFNTEAVKAALEWQSLVVIDPDYKKAQEGDVNTESTGSGSGSENDALEGTLHIGKPLFYVAMNGNTPSAELAKLVKKTIASDSDGNFTNALIEAQLASVQERARVENLYMVRFPVVERDGKFTAELESRTNVRDMKLTSDIEMDPADNLPDHAAIIEITTSANDYLPLQVSASVGKLYPKARWDYWNQYTSFTWDVDGVARAANSDGSITISAADVSKVVTLTSGALTAQVIVVQ